MDVLFLHSTGSNVTDFDFTDIIQNFTGKKLPTFPRGPEPPPAPPSHLFQDYIEIGCFVLVLVLGTPLNGYVFVQQISEYRKLVRAQKLELNTAFLLYKIHLNLANLMILLFYCIGQVAWLISYRWIAGNLMCKMAHFVWMVSFILSSNIVATIAVDRLRNVLKLDRLQRGKGKMIGGSEVMVPVKVG